jgi:hypothetical protein
VLAELDPDTHRPPIFNFRLQPHDDAGTLTVKERAG